MSKLSQREALIWWFTDHETINLAQAQAGLPHPDANHPKVRIERVAPVIFDLRNEGWLIKTEKDIAGVAHYRVVSRPGVPEPGDTGRVDPTKRPRDVRGDPKWSCSKEGCLSGVRPDQMHMLDAAARYTTGKCFTHGKTVLVRR